MRKGDAMSTQVVKCPKCGKEIPTTFTYCLACETPYIQSVLMPDEKLLAVVENLQYKLYFVPHVSPIQSYSPGEKATLALTNRRIIAVLWSDEIWRWLSISALNSLVERPLNKYRGGWPYQAILLIPGGIGLIVQTKTNSTEAAKQLSSLLVRAFMLFGTRRDDDGALAAILTHEEEEEERRRQATR